MSDNLLTLQQISNGLDLVRDSSDAGVNIGHALVAVATRMDTANMLAAAAVYVSLGDLSIARAILEQARRG